MKTHIVWTLIVGFLLIVIVKAIEINVVNRAPEFEQMECETQRYTVRGLPEMIVVCNNGGWFDTSSYNPDREEMILKLMETFK